MEIDAVLDMLKQVIVSWEVLAVTAVLVLYFSLVLYVGQLNRRPRPPAAPRKEKAPKAAIAAPPQSGAEEASAEGEE